MKVLVAVKRVIDFNVKPRVKMDGSGVDLANTGQQNIDRLKNLLSLLRRNI